jgi:hypothetical protein
MRLAILIAPILLAACSGGGEQPGAVTADEARELNEAAEMLDANAVSLNAVEDDEEPGE